MTIAIIGSRSLKYVDILQYLPKNVTRIITGGAVGIDTLAELFAKENGIPCEVITPNYEKYGKTAPLIRNKRIVDKAEQVMALWDGNSHGTKFTMDYAKQKNKNLIFYIITPQ